MLDQRTKKRALAALLKHPLPSDRDQTFSCLDPKHDDDNPSMSVSADGLVCCHGCDLQGDVIDVLACIYELDPRTHFARLKSMAETLASEVSASQRYPTGPRVPRRPPPKPKARRRASEALRDEANVIAYLELERGLSYSFCVEHGLKPYFDGRPGVLFGSGPKGSDRRTEHVRFIDGAKPKYKILGSPKTAVLFGRCQPI